MALPGFVRLHVCKEEERMGRIMDSNFSRCPLALHLRSLGFPNNMVTI